MNFNKYLFFQIQKLRGKFWGLDLVMIFASEGVILLIGLLIIFLGIIFGGSYRQALFLSLWTIPISLILIILLHLFIKERRPFITFKFKPLISFYKNLSFPSTHTTFMTILFFSQFYFHTNLSVISLLLLILVAFARIYIGVHYPVDILGGLVVGFISSVIATQISQYF